MTAPWQRSASTAYTQPHDPRALLPRNSVTTISTVQIEFDPDKRDKTLAERGLDFAQAGEVFAGVNVTAEDARFDYGEPRFTTVGVLDGRMVILVWTPRGEVRRIISMRKANEREIEKFAQALG